MGHGSTIRPVSRVERDRPGTIAGRDQRTDTMQHSKQGIALTELFEGCKLVAYKDATGRWTIGYGHTWMVFAGDTCTQAQAEAWLIGDYAWAEKAVNRDVKTEITQGEF